MRLKHLISHLQAVEVFDEPKINLEQYPTSAHIAGQMIYSMQTVYNDIDGKIIGDLGCGCGILTIATNLMGASANIAIDVDEDALSICKHNLEAFDIEDEVDLLQMDIIDCYRSYGCTDFIDVQDIDIDTKTKSSRNTRGKKYKNDDKKKIMKKKIQKQQLQTAAEEGNQEDIDNMFVECLLKSRRSIEFIKPVPIIDVIITNPPFGTRRPGIDLLFVKTGLLMCKTAVYSLHKTSTRSHIMTKAEAWGITATVVAELKFDVPSMYKFHKLKSKDIEVDFIRFAHPVVELDDDEDEDEQDDNDE